MATQRTLLDGNTGQKFDSTELLVGAAIDSGGSLPIGTFWSPLVWNPNTGEWQQGGQAVLGFSEVIHPSDNLKFTLYSQNSVLLDSTLVSSADLDWAIVLKAIPDTPYNAIRVFYDQASGEYRIGFFDRPPQARPTIVGPRSNNAALANLLNALEDLGLIINNTT